MIGVFPHFLKSKEIAYERLTELILVDSLHQRKITRNELCDGVIALPAGYGTLEEFFEMLTWAQPGLHKNPVALLNIDRYFDDLINFVQTMVDNGFLKEMNQQMLIIDKNIEGLLIKMKNYSAQTVGKWISEETV